MPAPGTPADEDTAGPARQVPADTIPLPAGSEFNRPPPEEAAVLPQVDTVPDVERPQAPAAPEPSLSGAIDTAPPPLPDVVRAPVSPAPLGPAPEIAGSLEPGTRLSRGADAPPVQPGAAAPAPVPQPVLDGAARTDVQDPPPAPPVPSPATGAAPDTADDVPTGTEEAPAPGAPIEDAPAPPEAPAPDAADATPDRPDPPPVVRLVPPAADAPDAAASPETGATEAPAEEALAEEAPPPPAPPRVLRPTPPAEDDADPAAETIAPRVLPQIVNPGRMDPATGEDAAPMPAPAEEPRPETALPAPDAPPALDAFATPFDADAARALIAVVLIDTPDPRLDLDTLTRFDFPVAFAIDPARPDAAERAALYRDAGFEVLMLGTVIPAGATATDTEVALAAARRRVPEAIALMDTVDSRIQSDRTVLEAVVGVAAGEGQGLLAFPRGLNTAEQMAARADVPAATFFRLLDDEDQRATVITRFLSRAEFAAAQEGAVVVAGRTRPDTVTALASWALGSRNEGVVIAPVSAVLERLAGTE
jgi:polysaccharide deacetylase 2 family uncharacterized protein YibQ